LSFEKLLNHAMETTSESGGSEVAAAQARPGVRTGLITVWNGRRLHHQRAATALEDLSNQP
jgi:hypothetical protein